MSAPDLGGLPGRDAQQFVVAGGEDVVRVAAGSPDDVVSGQRDVDDGAQRLRMPDGGDATDGEAGGLAHLVGGGLLDVADVEHRGDGHGVDPVTAGGHDEHGFAIGHEDEGVGDLTDFDAEGIGSLLRRARAVVKGTDLTSGTQSGQCLPNADDGLLLGDLAHGGSVAGQNEAMSPARPTDRFTGFPVEAFEFYAALADHNTRAWWQEHKADYERLVRQPMIALLEELSEEFGTPHVFRPYRDARFSKDKSPIKDHQGGVIQVEDAIAYYVQVSAAGLMVAGGWYAPEGRQVARFRESVMGPAGAELERILRELPRTWTVDGNLLKTHPRGIAPDHPRIDLLRHRRLVVTRTYDVAAWMGTTKTLTTVRSQWRSARPLVEWLADYVGPAGDPADAT